MQTPPPSKKLKREINSISDGTANDDSTTSSSDTDNNDDGPSPVKRQRNELGPGDRSSSAGSSSFVGSSVAEAMMRRMGHQAGRGLGKKGQGIVEPVKAVTVKGKSGLGFISSSTRPDFKWKEGDDPIVIRRQVDWLTSDVGEVPEPQGDWLAIEPVKLTLDDETHFVDKEILRGVLECKTFLDTMSNKELMDSRSRSNPYETVKNAIFMNRAALKMAEMDAVLQFSLSRPHDAAASAASAGEDKDLLHFADICAGPGGFTEYLLWRNRANADRGPRAKGYGLTLKGQCDFKLFDMLAGSPECFHPYYGPKAESDGNIYLEENMLGFRDLIMADTAGLGVHLITADGGFSVEGQENIQEIKSKQLYLCQSLTALLVLRDGGSFVCKLFDVFTQFSAGLMFLLYGAFDQFALFKPATSRPANSERYVVCRGYRRQQSEALRQYLLRVNGTINQLEAEHKGQPMSEQTDVQVIVPLDVVNSNRAFMDYLRRSNNDLGRMQIVGLSKIHHFFENQGMRDMRQEETRTECLAFWNIPDEQRGRMTVEKQEPTLRIGTLLGDSKMENLFPGPRAVCEPGGPPQTTEVLPKDKEFLTYDYQLMVSGGASSDVTLLFARGNNANFTLTRGKSRAKWCPLEAKSPFACCLPKDTLLLVQPVWEYKPPGYQLKETCLHVIDCAILQGQNLTDLPFSDRLSRIRHLCQCVNFAGVPGRNRLRPPSVFSAPDLLTDTPGGLRSRLALQAVKGSRMPRPMIKHSDGYVFTPTGLFMSRVTRDPWRTQLSRGKGQVYYYHRDGKEPTSFELRREFLAAFRDHLDSMVWVPWDASSSSASAGPGKDLLDLKRLLRIIDERLGRPVPQEYQLISRS